MLPPDDIWDAAGHWFTAEFRATQSAYRCSSFRAVSMMVRQGRRRPKLDWASERAQLLKRDAEWAAASSEGRDLERILSYWADDAIVLPPGLPAVVGKPAVRQYVQGSLRIPGFRIAWTSTDAAFSQDGSLAYLFSRNAVTMNGPDRTPTTTYGRGVSIWRREPSGEWRCVVDIWNAEPSA